MFGHKYYIREWANGCETDLCRLMDREDGNLTQPGTLWLPPHQKIKIVRKDKDIASAVLSSGEWERKCPCLVQCISSRSVFQRVDGTGGKIVFQGYPSGNHLFEIVKCLPRAAHVLNHGDERQVAVRYGTARHSWCRIVRYEKFKNNSETIFYSIQTRTLLSWMLMNNLHINLSTRFEASRNETLWVRQLWVLFWLRSIWNNM